MLSDAASGIGFGFWLSAYLFLVHQIPIDSMLGWVSFSQRNGVAGVLSGPEIRG